MPKFRMELRWTPKGLQHIGTYLDRRRTALQRAATLRVTGPNGGAIQIDETDHGPDWTVEGAYNDVYRVAAIFRWHGFVKVDVVGPLFTQDEFARIFDEFVKLRDAPSPPYK